MTSTDPRQHRERPGKDAARRDGASKGPAVTTQGGSRHAAWGLAMLLVMTLSASRALAVDPEGCLICHQYAGLARLDDKAKQIRLFFIDPALHSYEAGPHGRIKCTGCHERKEVEVFPHKQVSSVDCSRMCHLTTAHNVETRFSHDKMNTLLSAPRAPRSMTGQPATQPANVGLSLDLKKKLAHTPEVLERCKELLGYPVRKDQSTCLLCHDEPTFRHISDAWANHEAPINRCNTCHDEQLPLPVDTKFNFSHVMARSQPAMGNRDLVRTCAKCHANEAIRKEFNLPDSALSYLSSFHGKATMLNSDTASCLHCHVSEEQNVHKMFKHTAAEAPTHPDNVANTCRTAACHRLAGEQISSAAIHLDLSRSGGLEWIIAVVFVGMILGTFGPSMVVNLLKLLNIAVGRDDSGHHKHLVVVNKLMATPQGRQDLKRFSPHQRVQHWFLVLTFATLVLTGFPMKFADSAWAGWVIRTLGGLTVVRWIHRYTGALLLLGFTYHAIYIILHMRTQRKATGHSWLRVFFNLPLCMKPADLKEMNGLVMYLVGIKKTRPAGARFTAEEKFEYFGVFWGTALLGVTGLMMWFNADVSRWLPGRVLTVSNLIHSFEAFLALLHVGILHLATVIFSPAVFPISKAMFTGDTPNEEMAESHTEMIDEVAKKHGIEVEAHHD